MPDIGRRLREIRELKGMTQEELAFKCGYKSRSSINKIELERDIPLKKLHKIANALGVSASYVMGLCEDEKGDAVIAEFRSGSHSTKLTENDIVLLDTIFNRNSVNDFEFTLIEKYRSADDKTKAFINYALGIQAEIQETPNREGGSESPAD